MDTPTPYLPKRSLLSLKWKLLRFFNTGINTTSEYHQQNYIRLMNLVIAVSSFSAFLMSLLFLVTGLYIQSLACFLNSLFFIIPFHLNSRGRHLLGKIVTTVFTNSTLMLWCCVFTHHSILNAYFLFMGTVCIYLYRREEGMWISFLVLFSLLCFAVESTSLSNMLPDLNLVKDQADLNLTNFILLIGLIILLLGEVGSFVFLSGLREKKLSNTKKWLTASREKLAEQNQDLKTFGAAASHFLQTPIYVSRLFIEKIKHAAGAHYNDKEKQYFTLIEENLKQMEDFIRGLFSQYKIMEISTKNEIIDVLIELMKIRMILLQKFPNGNIALPKENIELSTNRLLFIIVVQNVLENGLRYNRSEIPKVDVFFKDTGRTISFFFADNGIGIDPAYKEKIFNPFMRIDHNDYIGTGLGLAGAKRAAEAIGGDLFCESSDANGSIFRLNINTK